MLLWQNTLDWGIVISHSPGVCEVQDDGWHQQVCCVASVVAYGRYLLVFSMEERQIRALGPHGPGNTEGQRGTSASSAFLTVHWCKREVSSAGSWFPEDPLNTMILGFKSQLVWFGETHVSHGRNPTVSLYSEHTQNLFSSNNSETSHIKLRFLHIECSDFWMIRGSEWVFFFLIINTVHWKVTYGTVMPPKRYTLQSDVCYP